MTKVYFPESPFAKHQAHRGVGRYTLWLEEALQKIPQFALVEKASEADLLHYTFFDLFVRSLKPPKKKPFVVTVHDLTPLVFPRDFPVGKRGKINLFFQKKRLRQAALIMTDSQASKNDIVKYFKIPENKVNVVYLAANSAFAPATAEQIKNVRLKYHLPQQYLLYVGDINFNKNLRQLIKTLKFLPDEIQLVMVGKNFFPHEIPEWYAIEEQLHLSEVEKRVLFLNQITSDTELAALYSGALAYLQPSYYEGFGLPILEAMQAQTPVICQPNSSLAEVAGQAAVFSDGLQGRDFAAAVEEVLHWTPEERHRRLKKAAAWAKNFTWDKTAHQVYQLYQLALTPPVPLSSPTPNPDFPKPSSSAQI